MSSPEILVFEIRIRPFWFSNTFPFPSSSEGEEGKNGRFIKVVVKTKIEEERNAMRWLESTLTIMVLLPLAHSSLIDFACGRGSWIFSVPFPLIGVRTRNHLSKVMLQHQAPISTSAHWLVRERTFFGSQKRRCLTKKVEGTRENILKRPRDQSTCN